MVSGARVGPDSGRESENPRDCSDRLRVQGTLFQRTLQALPAESKYFYNTTGVRPTKCHYLVGTGGPSVRGHQFRV